MKKRKISEIKNKLQQIKLDDGRNISRFDVKFPTPLDDPDYRKITEELINCQIEGIRKHLILLQHAKLADACGDFEESKRLRGCRSWKDIMDDFEK